MSTIKLNASSDIPKFIAASAVERHRMQNRTLYQLISKLSAEKVDYRLFFLLVITNPITSLLMWLPELVETGHWIEVFI